MATSSHHDPAVSGPIGIRPVPGVELLPLPNEPPAEYLARLKALHARVAALIDAIEERRPALGPMPVRPPRAPDRRAPRVGERRLGVEDRRRALPDMRRVPIERRFGRRDRRTPVAVDRREGFERRREPNPVPWEGRLRLNRVTLMWALQVVAWVAIALVALIYGIGG
jgi:hypothetical protein